MTPANTYIAEVARKLSIAFAYALVCISIISITASLSNLPSNSSFLWFLLVNPLSSILFILIAIVLLLLEKRINTSVNTIVVILIASFLVCVGGIRVIGIFGGVDLPLDRILPFSFGKELLPRITFNAAFNFILFGVSIILIYKQRYHRIAHILICMVLLIAFHAVLGYVYSVHIDYEVPYLFMPLTTAISFLFVSLSLLFIRPERGLMHLVTADTAGGIAVRRLLLPFIFFPTLLGWLWIEATSFNLFSPEYGMSVLIILLIAIFPSFIYSVANSLNRVDVMSKSAQNALEASHKKLILSNEELDKKLQESKHLLAALEASKIKLEQEKVRDETLLSSIGDGMVATDQNGKVVLMNMVAEEILGWKAYEVSDKYWEKEVPQVVDDKGEPIPYEKTVIATTLATKKKTIMSYVYVRRDGARIPVALTASPIIIFGQISGCIIVIRDVTKEKEVDRAKSEFVSLASHQLRTPLSAISWYTEMLISGDAGNITDEQRKYLEEVYAANKRMVELVNSLLNVSRLELGTFTIEPINLDLREIAHSVVEEINPQVVERQQQLKEYYQQNLPLLSADSKLIRIILQNLLSNAVKYTPEKGIISVEISLRDPNPEVIQSYEKHFVVKVSDTGYGIPTNQYSKIFSKLFRADNVREKDTEGTGLGLYIIKSIVEQAGGSVWFESEENKGTSFYVTFPLSGMQKKDGKKQLSG